MQEPGPELKQERDIARRYYQQSFDTAISYLRKAGDLHKELETYYIPHMRFREINELSRSVLEKILAFGGDSARHRQ